MVFWGKEYSQNIEGVSVVVINHNWGNPLFDNVKERFEIKKHNLSEIIPLQSCGKKDKLDVNMRNYTLDLLSINCSMEQIVRERNM